MRITQISLQNFKGMNFSCRLDPVTLIVGSNFAHKTSIPLAARLAMAGKLPPPIGTKGIYQLAGDSTAPGQMAIALAFDNGRQLTWSWTRDAAGKVSTKGGLTEDIAMPELLLDPRLFFAKTMNEQIQTIFQACDVSDFSSERIVNRLAEIHQPPADECEKVLEEITQWIRNKTVGLKPPVWIGMLIDWLSTERKSSADRAKTVSGSFAGLQNHGPQVTVDPTPELNTAMQELAQLRQASPDTAELERELNQVRAKGFPQRFQTVAEYDAELSRLGEPAPADEIEEIAEELCTKIMEYDGQIQPLSTRLEQLKVLAGQIQNNDACPVCGLSKKGWKTTPLKQIAEESGKVIKQLEVLETKKESDEKALKLIREWEALSKERAVVQGREQAIAQIEAEIAKRKAARAADPLKVKEMEARVSKFQNDLACFGAYQRDYMRRKMLEEQTLTLNCRVETFKAALGIVMEEQGKLIAEAFGQVLGTARMFTDGLLNSPLEFTEGRLGRRISDKDIRQGNKARLNSWVPFEAFSGTEELLALAGFGVALCQEAPVKLVILDEMGRLDGQRKTDVANRMIGLVGNGTIDQAILVDVTADGYPAPRPGIFSVIKV